MKFMHLNVLRNIQALIIAIMNFKILHYLSKCMMVQVWAAEKRFCRSHLHHRINGIKNYKK